MGCLTHTSCPGRKFLWGDEYEKDSSIRFGSTSQFVSNIVHARRWLLTMLQAAIHAIWIDISFADALFAIPAATERRAASPGSKRRPRLRNRRYSWSR